MLRIPPKVKLAKMAIFAIFEARLLANEVLPVKIGKLSVFTHVFPRFFRYSVFPNFLSLKSLFDLKIAHICTLKIFLLRLGPKSVKKVQKNDFFSKNSENSNDFLSESVPIVKIDLVVNFLQWIRVRPYFGRFQPWPKKNLG